MLPNKLEGRLESLKDRLKKSELQPVQEKPKQVKRSENKKKSSKK